MTITRDDVADLRAGDVVEYAGHPDLHGAVVRGPLHVAGSGNLCVGDYVVRMANGKLPNYCVKRLTLTVISRAKPPLYVNSDKTEPDPGDVVRIEPEGELVEDDVSINVYLPTDRCPDGPWMSIHNLDIGCRYSTDLVIPGHGNRAKGRAVLLVDGHTGQPPHGSTVPHGR